MAFISCSYSFLHKGDFIPNLFSFDHFGWCESSQMNSGVQLNRWRKRCGLFHLYLKYNRSFKHVLLSVNLVATERITVLCQLLSRAFWWHSATRHEHELQQLWWGHFTYLVQSNMIDCTNFPSSWFSLQSLAAAAFFSHLISFEPNERQKSVWPVSPLSTTPIHRHYVQQNSKCYLFEYQILWQNNMLLCWSCSSDFKSCVRCCCRRFNTSDCGDKWSTGKVNSMLVHKFITLLLFCK